MRPMFWGLLMLAACQPALKGSGRVTTEERPLEDIHRIVVCCDIDLTIQHGPRARFVAMADDNILEQLRARVEDGVLHVDYADGVKGLRPTQVVQVNITVTDLYELRVADGVVARVKPFATDSLRVEATGDSDVVFHGVRVDRELAVFARNHSVVRLEGSARHLDAELQKRSELSGKALSVASADIRMAGGSDAELAVEKELDVSGTGGSELTYHGQPAVSEDLSGLATIEQVLR